MKKNTMVTAGVAIAAAVGLALGGAALANADQTPVPDASGSSSPGTAGGDGATAGAANGNTDPSKPMRSDEQLLTGDVAAKVIAAAKAKEPGASVQRVETDSDGVYEAHVVRADGTPVIVQVDASFAVTNVQTGGPGGLAVGHRGPGSTVRRCPPRRPRRADPQPSLTGASSCHALTRRQGGIRRRPAREPCGEDTPLTATVVAHGRMTIG